MENNIKEVFNKLKKEQESLSLDELIYAVYKEMNSNVDFESYRKLILEACEINELEYYTRGVNKELIRYIEETYFSEYEKNDKGHGIIHVMEVIRRAFALNDTFKLHLDVNMIYAIASIHDIGKYIDHENHEKIAASIFYGDENFKAFFNDQERLTIKEAIEDHRSSKKDNPRSVYGKLISSADRNTRIEIVFIRSFFVAKDRMPEMNIEEYLDYTIKRLSKRYSIENPENMFFEDLTYKVFLSDMRTLLTKEEEFKEKYCEVNHISSRENTVGDEPGLLSYGRILK